MNLLDNSANCRYRWTQGAVRVGGHLQHSVNLIGVAGLRGGHHDVATGISLLDWAAAAQQGGAQAGQADGSRDGGALWVLGVGVVGSPGEHCAARAGGVLQPLVFVVGVGGGHCSLNGPDFLVQHLDSSAC